MNNPIILPDGEVDKFISRRVCSRCYGDLQKQPSNHRMWSVQCPACGDAWGYTTISRNTAVRMGQRAISERMDVEHNLPDLFPNPHKGKSEEQIKKELGY